MNILYGSDIHLEYKKVFVPDRYLVDAADIIVLAGDIHNHTHGIIWARNTFKDKPIIYVAGNHEYDSAHMGGLLSQMRIVAKQQNVNFLEGNMFTFRGINFYGTSLWTDYMLFGEQLFQTCLFEHNLIMPQYMNASKARGKLIRSDDLLKLHRRSRMFLTENLHLKDKSTNIVVSHTAPSMQSVTGEYQTAYTSAAFASHLDNMLLSARYWIHGHLHTKRAYAVNGCQVLSNCICNHDGGTSDMEMLVIPD